MNKEQASNKDKKQQEIDKILNSKANEPIEKMQLKSNEQLKDLYFAIVDWNRLGSKDDEGGEAAEYSSDQFIMDARRFFMLLKAKQLYVTAKYDYIGFQRFYLYFPEPLNRFINLVHFEKIEWRACPIEGKSFDAVFRELLESVCEEIIVNFKTSDAKRYIKQIIVI